LQNWGKSRCNSGEFPIATLGISIIQLSVANGSNLTYGKKIGRKRVDVRNAKQNFTAEIVMTITNAIKKNPPTIIWEKS